jgi:hypothetical protein
MSTEEQSEGRARISAMAAEIREDFETRSTALKKNFNLRLQKELDNLTGQVARCNLDLEQILAMDKESITDHLKTISGQIEENRASLEALEYKLIEDRGADFVIFLKNIELRRKGKSTIPRDETVLYPEYSDIKKIIANLFIKDSVYNSAMKIHRLKTDYDDEISSLKVSLAVRTANVAMQEGLQTLHETMTTSRPPLWRRWFRI